MGSEGFTQLQLKQLRDVMQGTIEDFLRDVVRSEFEALRHTERRPGKRLTKGFLGTGSDSVNQGQDHSANLSPRHSSKSEARTSTSQMQRAPAKRVTPQRTRSSDQRWRDMVQNSSNVLSVANNMSYYEKLRLKAQRLIHKGSRFDAVVGFIIVANSVCIGIETQLRLEGDLPVHFAWFESFFLICFILELVVRWVADGVHNLKLKWFWFDVTLVLSGAVCSWILEPLEPVSNADDVPVISQVLTLRVLRLMRLVRAVRLIEQFRELWRLCCGLTKSVRTMLSVCLLVLVVVFVFACMGVEMIANAENLSGNEDTVEIVRDHFSSLPMAILTLMQFANADSIASVYMPICRAQPAFAIYFLVLWLVVTIALMNLVTAIIVENALAHGREDIEERQHEMRKVLKRIIPEIEEVFDKLDSDRSGVLTFEEIEAASNTGELALPEDIREIVEPHRLLEIFEFLDMDQSGDIEIDEFVDGVCSLAVSAVPIETTQILQLIRRTHHSVMAMERDLQRMLSTK